MVMPQRDDPPSRCALRRTGTIEAIKRRAAEKKAEGEKKKAEARGCAARCRLKRCPPIFARTNLLQAFNQFSPTTSIKVI